MGELLALAIGLAMLYISSAWLKVSVVEWGRVEWGGLGYIGVGELDS